MVHECIVLRSKAMASLCLNSLPLPPPSRPRKLIETCSSSTSSSLTTSSIGYGKAQSLKPIVVRGNPPTFVSAPGRRIVAGSYILLSPYVGDLHGDIEQTRCALEMAGVLSSDGQDLWTGGETVLIQLGDILDRGEDEIAILSLLRSLDTQAKAQGGAVFQVNGNHETMNVEGDYRYVDLGAFDECIDYLEYLNDYGSNWEEAFVNWISISKQFKEDRKMYQKPWSSFNLVKRQKGVIARSILLRPGGHLACELARHAVVLKVNDWVFCHGGLLPHHVGYGIERLNREVSIWMRGLSGRDDGPPIPFIATRGYDSVVWNRLYSRDTSELEDCKVEQIHSILRDTLLAVGARGMVVGHTPQTIGVNCKYDCSIWRVDVGMSSGVLNSRPEVLEIRDNNARVIRSKRNTLSELQVVDYT